jgi:hypothetical protein
MDRSSLNPDLYLPTFAGFVDTDLSDGKISLRSLVSFAIRQKKRFASLTILFIP